MKREGDPFIVSLGTATLSGIKSTATATGTSRDSQRAHGHDLRGICVENMIIFNKPFTADMLALSMYNT